MYSASGQQTAALQQYERLGAALREQLGVPPSPETVDLLQAVRERRAPQPLVAGSAASKAPTLPRHNLPAQTTPFIGRGTDLDQIARLLAQPSCRLLTIVGLGGIGKTRLAIEAAMAQLNAFTDGAWFVPLVSIGSPERLASAILSALDVLPIRSLGPDEQLLDFLRQREMLLVLDNFEHLLEATSLVREMVDGMPLAIELAAPWTRVLPCKEIAREIEGGLDVLTTSLRDVPQRHRSMRSVFDHSWDRLSDEEQNVLQKLSVFGGGFRRDAACAVAQVSLTMLCTLIDRSWLRAAPSGRYHMHELIRQYASEQLASERLDTDEGYECVRDRHCRYYAAFLHECEPRLYGQGQKEAFDQILEEMGNVWAAWDWAVERGHVERIGQCVRALEEVAELRGWHHDVHQAFDRVGAKLRERLRAPEDHSDRAALEDTRLVLAEILRSQGLESAKLGSPERAKILYEESLDLLSAAPDDPRQREAVAHVKGCLGWILWVLGEPLSGNQLMREAVALSDEIGDSRLKVALLIVLASTPHHLGQHEEAMEILEQARVIASDAGDLRYKAWCLSNLSELRWTIGEYARARLLGEESLQVRQQIGDRAGTADSYLALGRVAIALGDYGSARKHYQDCLQLATQTGGASSRCGALNGLGLIALALGRHREAKQWFEESLDTLRRMGSRRMMSALIGLRRASCALGEVQ